MRSLELDHCWVCKVKFGGKEGLRKNEHHIVPRASGGVEGPTVTLCADHHTLLHHIATRLITGKEYFDLLTHDVEKDKKLLFLASRVQAAALATKDDPNKRVLMPLSFDAGMIQKLKSIAAMHRLSRADTVKALIEREYLRLFPRK